MTPWPRSLANFGDEPKRLAVRVMSRPGSGPWSTPDVGPELRSPHNEPLPERRKSRTE